MHRRSPQSESGYILLAVLFMVVLILIALAVAAPRIATEIQRDREAELIQRGKQYTRAIKLYYKKFGRYPSSIDQLENTNNMRFLRKRYTDPMTGKDDWKIIHFGQAHVKAMGLFGQPIQNTGNAGGNVLGGTAGLSPTLPGSTIPSTSSISSTSSSSSSTSNTDSSAGSTDSSGSNPAGTPSSTNTTSLGSTSPFSGSTGSTFGSGQTFGGSGGPIVGVASKSAKASIKEYKQQKHYNEWEFVYDPVEDLMSSVSIFGGGSLTDNASGSNSSSPFSTPNNQNQPISPTSGPTSSPPTQSPQ